MENIHKNRTLVRFSAPDPDTNSIVVSRVLPDNSAEPIGKIYPDFGDGEDFTMYISANIHGEVLFPATPDFVDLENKFEKYSKELAEKSLVEGMEAEDFEKREETIKSLRNWKIKKKEILQINL